MSQSGSWFNTSGPGAVVETLTGNTGGPVGPNAGNINILGVGNIIVNGFPALNDLFIGEISPSAITFDADSGSAMPTALGVITFAGGTNVMTSATANTVTINATGAGSFVWTVVTAGTQAISPFNGYIANNGGTLVFTMPSVAAVGDTYRITGINNDSGWQIAQNAGQTIYIGNMQTTTGVTGYLKSTQTRDSVEIICVIANSSFNVLSSIGNILVN